MCIIHKPTDGVGAPQAAKATGTKNTQIQVPAYLKESQPADFSRPNMQKCVQKCRYMCEASTEAPAVDGLPVRPGTSHTYKYTWHKLFTCACVE